MKFKILAIAVASVHAAEITAATTTEAAAKEGSHLSAEQQIELRAQIDEAIQDYLMQKQQAETKQNQRFMDAIKSIHDYFKK